MGVMDFTRLEQDGRPSDSFHESGKKDRKPSLAISSNSFPRREMSAPGDPELWSYP